MRKRKLKAAESFRDLQIENRNRSAIDELNSKLSDFDEDLTLWSKHQLYKDTQNIDRSYKYLDSLDAQIDKSLKLPAISKPTIKTKTQPKTAEHNYINEVVVTAKKVERPSGKAQLPGSKSKVSPTGISTNKPVKPVQTKAKTDGMDMAQRQKVFEQKKDTTSIKLNFDQNKPTIGDINKPEFKKVLSKTYPKTPVNKHPQHEATVKPVTKSKPVVAKSSPKTPVNRYPKLETKPKQETIVPRKMNLDGMDMAQRQKEAELKSLREKDYKSIFWLSMLAKSKHDTHKKDWMSEQSKLLYEDGLNSNRRIINKRFNTLLTAKNYKQGKYKDLQDYINNADLSYLVPSFVGKDSDVRLAMAQKGKSEMIKNYVVGKYNKYMMFHDTEVDKIVPMHNVREDKPKMSKLDSLKIKYPDVEDPTLINKDYVSNDTVWFDNDKTHYSVRTSVNMDNKRYGVRNRDLWSNEHDNNSKAINNTKGILFGTMNEQHFTDYDTAKKQNADNDTYIGVDVNGKFKTGFLKNFKPGDTLAKTLSFVFNGFKKDNNGNVVLKETSSNPGAKEPVIKTDTGEEMLNLLNWTSDLNKWGDTKRTKGVNNTNGGGILVETPYERRFIRGSTNDIIQLLEALHKNYKYKPLRIYKVDNGSFSKGMMTTKGYFTPADLFRYDHKNTRGGNAVYELK